MSRIIATNNGDKYKTPSTPLTAGAILVGAAANAGVNNATKKFLGGFLPEMRKISRKIDNAHLRTGIEKAFINSGLKQNGVEIINAAEQPNKLMKSLGMELPKWFKNVNIKNQYIIKCLMKKGLIKSVAGKTPKSVNLHKMYTDILALIAKQGSNAFYASKSNNVILNINKIGVAAFHEMGHAINKNKSKFWSFVQKTRVPLKILSPIFFVTALTKRKKLEGEQPKNTFDKVTTFIKNNVGTLVTLSFVPMIAEELKATQRGNKLAKKVLSADAFQNVKLCNRLGAFTYIVGAIAAGIGALLASELKDVIAKPQKV